MAERSTLVVQLDSWHGRVYRFWQRNGGRMPPAYRENLCHYVRVVAIYGPAHWIAFKPLLGRWWLTPGIVISVALITLSAVLIPPLVIVGLWIGLSTGLFLIGRWTRAHPGVLAERASRWWSRWSPWWPVPAILAAGGIGAVTALWPIDVLRVVAICLMLMLGMALVAGALALVGFLIERRQDKHSKDPDAATARHVVREYVKARKARVCPFIDITE